MIGIYNNSNVGDLYRTASEMLCDPSAERDAVRLWLKAAIKHAGDHGIPLRDIAPAIKLLTALENLDFGHTDTILQPPSNLKRGRQPKPPSEAWLEGFAIAATERLAEGNMSVSEATKFVEEKLEFKTGSLSNLRKKMHSERSKPPSKRRKYEELIYAYEEAKSELSEDAIGNYAFKKILDKLDCLAELKINQ